MSSLYSNSTLKPNSASQQLEPSISVESKARKENAWLLSYIGIFIALLAFFILIISLLKLETSVPKRSHQTLVFNLEEVLLSQKQQYGLDWLNIDATPTKGVRISLAQDLVAGEPMFASAQAQINPAYLPNLRKLLAMLQAVNVNVMEQRYSKLIGKIESSGYKLKLVWRIEGHTDANPIQPTARFRNNVELSAFRAYAVMHWLRIHLGEQRDRFSIAGYGSSQPISNDPFAPNNRRIEIYLIPLLVPVAKDIEVPTATGIAVAKESGL